MQETTNYRLKKPESNDNVEIGDINDNTDIIDKELKKLEDDKAPKDVATTSKDGLMSRTDKSKLNGIASGANNYSHPSTHPATMIIEDTTHRFVTDNEKNNWNNKAPKDVATTSKDGLMSRIDKSKLDGIASGANNYSHPSTHPATMITEDELHRFLTDMERVVIQAWENFKANGGEIGGDITLSGLLKFNDNVYAKANDDELALGSSGKNQVIMNSTELRPTSNKDMNLGSDLFRWKDLWLGDYSKNTNGYTKLPNGLILQWGRVAIATGNSVTVNLPIAFPNAMLSIQATGEYGTTDRYTLTIGNVGRDNLSIYKRTFSSGTSTDFCYWMALGC